MGVINKLFGRLKVNQDPSVTTQVTAVIQSNSGSLALVPESTGAIIASIPDGAATGGNARGTNAVDLQTFRVLSTQVASGNFSGILSGERNAASSLNTVISGGRENNVSSQYGAINGGFGNINSSQYGVISGGQSNTASTNNWATVVGGQSNTSSGQHSISGGNGSTASAAYSIALGRATATANNAVAIGGFSTISGPTASGTYAVAMGQNTTAAGSQSVAIGGSGTNAQGLGSVALGAENGAGSSYSFAIGYQSLTHLIGQSSLASGKFGTQGDNQQSTVTSRREATLATAATTVLSLDGTGTTNLIIPNGTNRAWNVQIDTIAVVTTITGTATGVNIGDCYRETKQLLFKRIGTISSIVGTVDTTAIKSDTSMSACALTITAGGSQEMALTFTGPTFTGGGSVNVRVVSKVMLVEVAY